MREVLKLPAYRRLLTGYTLNELAWSIGSVALSFLVYRHTGSAIGAAAFFLCSQFVPALFSTLVVARLDQGPPQPVLTALYLAEALVYLGLALLARSFSLAPILVLAVIDGLIALVARSLTRASTVAVTTEAGLLREGNAVSNTAFSVTFMAGPAIGGAIVAVGSVSSALFLNSALFGLIALTLASARGLPGAASERTPSAGRVRAALAHARARAKIRSLLSLQAAAVLFFTVSIPVEVVFAQHTLHAGAGGYGGLLSAWGAGAVAGSLIFARWHEVPPRRLISLGAAALGIGFLVMAAAPTIAVAIIGSAVGGVGNGVEAVSARTALQEEVEAQWMALIMSLNESMFQVMPGAGIVIGGAVTSLAGPRAALTIGGVGSLVITALAWIVLRPGSVVGRAVDEPPLGDGTGPRAKPASATRHR